MAYTSTSTVSPTVTSALLERIPGPADKCLFLPLLPDPKNYQKSVHAIHRKWSKTNNNDISFHPEQYRTSIVGFLDLDQ
jgi:hypothetical protein